MIEGTLDLDEYREEEYEVLVEGSAVMAFVRQSETTAECILIS